MHFRKIIKPLSVFLITLVGLLLFLILVINLPFSHRIITREINQIFRTAGLPIRIGDVNYVRPGSLKVEDLIISGSKGDTIIFAGKVSAGFKTFRLIRKKVILPDVDIENATVSFSRIDSVQGLNIALAFSKDKAPEDKEVPASKKQWEVSVGKASLSDISFSMTDSAGGLFIRQYAEFIRIESEKMSLVNKTAILKSLSIKGLTGSIFSAKPGNTSGKEKTGSPWNFGLAELNTERLNFLYEDKIRRFRLDILSGELSLRSRKTDIKHKSVDFNDISVSSTDIAILMDKEPEKGVKTTEKGNNEGSSPFQWNIAGDRINLDGISFRLAGYGGSQDTSALPGLSVLGLNVLINDLELKGDNIRSELKKLSFDMGNGFSVKSMSASLGSKPGNTEFDFKLETGNSKIDARGSADAAIMKIIDDPSAFYEADLLIGRSSVSLTDILMFKSGIAGQPVINSLKDNPVGVECRLKLRNSVLTVSGLGISLSPGMEFVAEGHISNIFELKKAGCDIKYNIGQVDTGWLTGLIGEMKPDYTLPSFNALNLDGTVSDSILSPSVTLNIRSDLGNARINGTFLSSEDRFSLNSSFKNVQLDRILKNQLLGSFSGSADLSGKGIKAKKLSAKAMILIDTLSFRDYVYTGTRNQGEISPGEYSVDLVIDDPSLKLGLNTAVRLNNSELSAKTKGEFRGDLSALNLMKDTIAVEGILSAGIVKRGAEINANAVVSGIGLKTPAAKATIDSIELSLLSDSLKTTFASESDFYDISGFITRPISGISGFIQDLKNNYQNILKTSAEDTVDFYSSLPGLEFKASLRYHDGLGMFVPDTSLRFNVISLAAKTGQSGRSLKYEINGKDVRYSLFNISDIRLGLVDSSAIMDLSLTAYDFSVASQPFNKLALNSSFRDWQSLTTITIIDDNAREIYKLDYVSDADSNAIFLRSPSRQIILNGTKWDLDSPDIAVFDKAEKSFSPDIHMHTAESDISITSGKELSEQVYNLNLTNVKLNSLISSELLPGQPGFSLTGSARFGTGEWKDRKINADLVMSDVIWSSIGFDRIALNGHFDSDTTGGFDLDAKAMFDSSLIEISGSRQSEGNGSLDIKLDMIPVGTFQPFVDKFLSDLDGSLSGRLNLSAKNSVGSFNGELELTDWKLKVIALNSVYRMPADQIKFSGKKVLFDNFTVIDSLNNELQVDGFLDFSKRNAIVSDLEISSSDLQVMNKEEEKNSTFYGKIFIDTQLSIEGLVASPVLKGKIALSGGTDIYFRQSENLNLSESEKVITFVSSKDRVETKMPGSASGAGIYNRTSIESIVEIDPDTRLNINISKRMFNIDMSIQGGGELNYNMLVNNQVDLAGKYEVSEGSANLKMIGWPNKAFRIARGGYIRWDGKLDDPELQFEALNRVKSSYTNPIDNKDRYVDFDVTLKIANRLSDMDVQFTITTSDQYLMSIINTLSPEEKMRQAITILLFKKIDLPGISTSSNYMTEQVNQMLASQLNALTKTTIKGIDISFGVDTYTQATESGGEQTKTSLSYELKRSLLNDRAQIQLSGRLNDVSNQPNASSLSLNNVSFEYRLDSAATKFLKVYNEHTYEDVFEGEVIKTGIGITYRKNYPTLRAIWRKEEREGEPENAVK